MGLIAMNCSSVTSDHSEAGRFIGCLKRLVRFEFIDNYRFLLWFCIESFLLTNYLITHLIILNNMMPSLSWLKWSTMASSPMSFLNVPTHFIREFWSCWLLNYFIFYYFYCLCLLWVFLASIFFINKKQIYFDQFEEISNITIELDDNIFQIIQTNWL